MSDKEELKLEELELVAGGKGGKLKPTIYYEAPKCFNEISLDKISSYIGQALFFKKDCYGEFLCGKIISVQSSEKWQFYDMETIYKTTMQILGSNSSNYKGNGQVTIEINHQWKCFTSCYNYEVVGDKLCNKEN